MRRGFFEELSKSILPPLVFLYNTVDDLHVQVYMQELRIYCKCFHHIYKEETRITNFLFITDIYTCMLKYIYMHGYENKLHECLKRNNALHV